MTHRPPQAQRRLRSIAPIGLVATLLFSLAALCPAPAAEPNGATATFDLADFLQLARQHQPRIAAQRASVAAAEDGRNALDSLRFPATLDPEIPIRRKQSRLGVTAAAAALDVVERDTTYSVARTYFTVIYAREQERLARGVVERLSTIRSAAQTQLDAGAEGITSSDVGRTQVYLRLAETRQTQAVQGVKRALVALREAVGLGPEYTLDVPPARLTEPDAQPNRDEIVAAALSRRGDLLQALIFAEVACLEVEAQGSTTHQRMQTFAAGSDIHSRLIQQGVHNGEYRPGAVPPEMPTLLAGGRQERMKTAEDLHNRALAVAETTRVLIALEAEDAFLRWEEARQQAAQARDAADAGDKLAEGLTRDFNARLKVKVDDVITARVLASQARSQLNDAVNHEILALIDLERITAGGFCANLAARTPPAAEAPPKAK